jgi:hypothetical protein
MVRSVPETARLIPWSTFLTIAERLGGCADTAAGIPAARMPAAALRMSIFRSISASAGWRTQLLFRSRSS